jgi:hypothetical protein
MRLKQAEELGLETFGLSDLVPCLLRLNPESPIRMFGIKSVRYIGTCSVTDEVMLGCEFITRGNAISKPGLWIDGTKID